MRFVDTAVPTSSAGPPDMCPRCDSLRVAALEMNAPTAFEWYECAACGHLWAIPRGWTLYSESRRS